jgi:hypothetical protein
LGGSSQESLISSRMPGAQSKATHGTPQAIASSTAIGKPSAREDSANTEASLTAAPGSGAGPANSTRPAIPRASAWSRKSCSSSPEPHSRSRHPEPEPEPDAVTSAHAARSMSRPFSKDSRPSATTTGSVSRAGMSGVIGSGLGSASTLVMPARAHAAAS